MVSQILFFLVQERLFLLTDVSGMVIIAEICRLAQILLTGEQRFNAIKQGTDA